ncbi:MAG TPA: hypothetical protein VMD53_18010 [Rhizomicrobium sp.]|nr:hypothetical protein [Rhizomicrobium sp.]
MLTTLLHLSRQANALVVAAVAFCALLAPVKSFAQPDQPIVMLCKSVTNPSGTELMITLDMTKMTVVVQLQLGATPLGTRQGMVTSITDQQFAFSTPRGSQTDSYTLNRYTGDLSATSTGLTSTGLNGSSPYACRKQQRQF